MNNFLIPRQTSKDWLTTLAVITKTEEIRKECIMLVEQIIESKKAISADYSGDSKFLDKLKKGNKLS